MQAVLDADPQELVPGGMELDLVVAAELRRVLVREAAELERLAADEPSERCALRLALGAALAPERLREHAVLREDVVPLERRRLVRCEEVRIGGHSERTTVFGSVNASSTWLPPTRPTPELFPERPPNGRWLSQ